ncbi:MAG: hypothetical protein P4L53_06625 [Candidatus Obscuribacterales bacterium]|nr:hypothetical protein [Candidatus Obscuribacterales bacterium]
MISEEFKRKLRRPMGALFVVLSIVEAKFFIFDVLESCKHGHGETISYDERGIYLPFLTLMLGVLLLFFGDKQQKLLLTSERKLSKAGWLLVVVILAVGFGASEWFKVQVKEMGYVPPDTLELRYVDAK